MHPNPPLNTSHSTNSPSVKKPRLFLIPNRQPQHKINNNRRKQRNRQNRRPQPIIKAPLTPHPYTPCAPMESKQSVHHRHHGHDRKQPSADFTNVVAEVQEADGQAAEDDGEVEP
jgi:hypothetical protein